LRLSKCDLEKHDDTFVSCIEDPGQQIGSGGATLNALIHSIEFIQAKNRNKVL
jgi:hypothetical protein